MSREDILNKVASLLEDNGCCEKEDVKESCTYNELDIDDLDIEDLCIDLEEEYDVFLDDDLCESFEVISDLIDYLEGVLDE